MFTNRQSIQDAAFALAFVFRFCFSTWCVFNKKRYFSKPLNYSLFVLPIVNLVFSQVANGSNQSLECSPALLGSKIFQNQFSRMPEIGNFIVPKFSPMSRVSIDSLGFELSHESE